MIIFRRLKYTQRCPFLGPWGARDGPCADADASRRFTVVLTVTVKISATGRRQAAALASKPSPPERLYYPLPS